MYGRRRGRYRRGGRRFKRIGRRYRASRGGINSTCHAMTAIYSYTTF